MPDAPPDQKHVDLITTRAAFASFAVGLLGFIVADSTHVLDEHEIIKLLTIHVSALLVATAPLALIWEKLTRRVFLSEVRSELSKIVEIKNAHQSVEDTALTRIDVVANFEGELDWEDYFRHAREIDVLVAYAYSWRGAVGTHFERAAARSDFIKARVFLPDPARREVMQELGSRMSKTAEEVEKSVREASDDFKRMFTHAPNKLELIYHRAPLAYSAYRFDDRGIVAFFRYRPGRVGRIPVLCFARGGTLFDFLAEELEAIIKAWRTG